MNPLAYCWNILLIPYFTGITQLYEKAHILHHNISYMNIMAEKTIDGQSHGILCK